MTTRAPLQVTQSPRTPAVPATPVHRVRPSPATGATLPLPVVARRGPPGGLLARVPATAADAAALARAAGPGATPALLDRLRALVTSTGNEVLGDRWRPESCPDMHAWFARHQETDPAHLERILRRFGRVDEHAAMDDAMSAAQGRLASSLQRWGSGEKMQWQMGARGLPVAFEEDEGPAERGSGEVVAPADLGPGAPLAGQARADAVRAFGKGFEHVQVHHNAEAGRTIRRLGADALAVGNHLGFRPGAYQPHTPAGRRLIAHELGHVLQGPGKAGNAPAPVRRSRAHEGDADRVAGVAVARLGGLRAPPPRATVSAAPSVQLGNLCNSNTADDVKKASTAPTQTASSVPLTDVKVPTVQTNTSSNVPLTDAAPDKASRYKRHRQGKAPLMGGTDQAEDFKQVQASDDRQLGYEDRVAKLLERRVDEKGPLPQKVQFSFGMAAGSGETQAQKDRSSITSQIGAKAFTHAYADQDIAEAGEQDAHAELAMDHELHHADMDLDPSAPQGEWEQEFFVRAQDPHRAAAIARARNVNGGKVPASWGISERLAESYIHLRMALAAGSDTDSTRDEKARDAALLEGLNLPKPSDAQIPELKDVHESLTRDPHFATAVGVLQSWDTQNAHLKKPSQLQKAINDSMKKPKESQS